MIKICLDAGHGITTPGKRSPDGTLLEYVFNRQMVKIVAKLLEPYKDEIEVIYTQDPDNTYDLSLPGRCKVANQNKVDYFISIHANASNDENKWDSATGWEVYIYGKGGKAEKLANSIEQVIRNNGIKSRGVKVGNFQVIRETTMPAILIESGFMTNQNECKKLLTQDYRVKLGTLYVEGLLNYLGINKKVTEGNVQKLEQLLIELTQATNSYIKTYNNFINEVKDMGYNIPGGDLDV